MEDDGKTMALTKGGVTDLARIAGRTNLVRGLGGFNLVRITRRTTEAFLLCHHRQEGGGWGLPRAACYRLHLGRCPGPSLSAHLQAVCSRGECSPPKDRGLASSQVVHVCHHVQFNGSTQVRSNSWCPPDALLSSYQQRASHHDPHQWRRRTQRSVRRDVQQSPSAL